jgi:indolepyruvate decarboxylase
MSHELDGARHRIKHIRGVPVLVEVVFPEEDLPGQMRRLGSE